MGVHSPDVATCASHYTHTNTHTHTHTHSQLLHLSHTYTFTLFLRHATKTVLICKNMSSTPPEETRTIQHDYYIKTKTVANSNIRKFLFCEGAVWVVKLAQGLKRAGKQCSRR